MKRDCLERWAILHFTRKILAELGTIWCLESPRQLNRFIETEMETLSICLHLWTDWKAAFARVDKTQEGLYNKKNCLKNIEIEKYERIKPNLLSAATILCSTLQIIANFQHPRPFGSHHTETWLPDRTIRVRIDREAETWPWLPWPCYDYLCRFDWPRRIVLDPATSILKVTGKAL